MFILMAVGRQPFYTEKEDLLLEFSPVLKADLFTRKKENINVNIDGKNKDFTVPKESFCFKFLGDTLVTYRNPKKKDTYSSTAKIQKINIKYKDGTHKEILSSLISLPDSERIRKKQAESIEVFIK